MLGKATDLRSSSFFSFILDLHRRMLVERGIRNLLVGVAAVIFVVLELSGLVLWAPTKLKQWRRWKMWKPGFQIKWSANWKRINHDLHNSLVFYTFGVVTVLALKGLCWSFKWYCNGVSTVFGAKVFGGAQREAAAFAAARHARPFPLGRRLSGSGQPKPALPRHRASKPA